MRKLYEIFSLLRIQKRIVAAATIWGNTVDSFSNSVSFGRKFNQNQFYRLLVRRSISYKFEKHFWFNLPYPTAKFFSNQLAKTFSHLQIYIFCHFNISNNRKNASAHSIFFARFRRRKGKKFRKNGRLSSMGLLAFLFTIFIQCIDCH